MVAFRTIAAAFVGLAAFAQDALAHSTQRNPLKYITVLEDPVLHSPSQHCHALSHFDLTFTLHNGQQQVRLALEPNHDILQQTFEVNYMSGDGKIHKTESVPRSEHRVFRGKTFIRHEGHSEWTNAGWARITIHRDGVEPVFEGAFRIDGDHHHIQTGSNYRARKHRLDPDAPDRRNPDDYMVVWRDSDVIDYWAGREDLKRDVYGRTSCSSDSLDFNADYKVFDAREPKPMQSVSQNSLFGGSLFGRQIDGSTGNNGAGVNLVSTIGQTNGCPTTRKIALLGVATDCTYTAAFNSTQAVRSNIIQVINAASEVYESSFNISLGIQNLTISDANCPGQASSSAPWNVACSPSITITDRLNLFSAWRGNSKDTNAFWTLLSTCGTDSAVGLAWLGQACTTGAQTSGDSSSSNETVASANVVIQTPTEWQVVAHEVGHTFGAVHDCASDTCSSGDADLNKCCPLSSSTCNAGGQFIMNPSTGSGIKAFSPCSIGNICSGLLRNQVKSTCLTNNRDVNTITGSQCGNGIVESGEDCDCGGTSGCGNNNCCNPTTCKFTSNSVCDPANEDCCNSQCQFATNGTVCRQSTGSCDPEETCSGNSALCPSDKHKDDGDSCGNSGQGLTCASGQCTSRDQQCKTAWGARTNASSVTACQSSSSDCMISCNVPSLGSGCVTMNQNFLDGTSCTGGGKCSNGQCVGSNAADVVLDWINNNKAIFIPIVVVVGLLVLISLCSCIRGACRRSRSRTMARRLKPVQPPMNGWNGYGGAWSNPNVPPPPPVASRPGAPPQYAPYPNNWEMNRTQSARYA